jgi:hypothetical protein
MLLPDWSDLCGHLWCSALQNSWPGCGVEGLVLHWNHPDFMAFVCCLFSMSIVLGFIDCASTDPVIQSNQRPHLYMFFSQWPRCNMFHFCMDIRLRLFSSHYMVPRSLGQRTIMNVSSWIIFKLLARVTKLIFRSNINLNSACLQKEEHVLARASCTNRQDTFMDVIARWIRAITLGKGRHFLTPWPMA